MRTGLLLVCGLAVSLQAQQDPGDLLLQVRNRVKDSIDRLPKYICTQTIDRLRYEPVNGKQASKCDDGPAPKDLRVTTSDRLRFDVGVTGAGEIYSWAGARRFDDRRLFDLVREGSISNGIFAAFLTAIFRDEVLAPAGAIVTARLVRIRRFFVGVPSVSLGLKLETIELGGASVPLRARPNFALRTFTTRPGTLAPRVELGTLSDLEDRAVTVFQFRNLQPKQVISHGLELSWITIEP
jgi:hypothetical protein